MFKKRYAEMDLYQEYRRSHERVKVMLNEKPEDILDEPSVPPSAQDNLQKFISLHETNLKKIENEYEEQNAINLAEDTIPKETITSTDYPTPEMFPPIATGPEQPPITSEADYQQNYYPPYQFSNSPESVEPSLQLRNEQEFYNEPQTMHYRQEMNPPYANQEVRIENKEPIRPKKVEEELDDVIREALEKVTPNTNILDSDIDPELMNLIKNLLVKNNLTIFDSSQLMNHHNDFWNIPESSAQSATPQAPEQAVKEPQKGQSTERIPTSIDQQLKKQQIPPKAPATKTTVKRPEVAGQPGVFDPSFSTADVDDDSSLALTKQEISLQVKNLLRESLQETQQETSKVKEI